MPSPEAIYDEHARQCDEQDFWRQVRRTVNGEPVPEEQIDMIVAKMIEHLELGAEDVLLDICCGNGALSYRFFEACRGGLGVDFSQTLIGVAQKYFDQGPAVAYRAGEAIDYLREEPEPQRFTKARGVRFGPKPKLTEHQRAKALARLAAGDSCREIARATWVSATVRCRGCGVDA